MSHGDGKIPSDTRDWVFEVTCRIHLIDAHFAKQMTVIFTLRSHRCKKTNKTKTKQKNAQKCQTLNKSVQKTLQCIFPVPYLSVCLLLPVRLAVTEWMNEEDDLQCVFIGANPRSFHLLSELRRRKRHTAADCGLPASSNAHHHHQHLSDTQTHYLSHTHTLRSLVLIQL